MELLNRSVLLFILLTQINGYSQRDNNRHASISKKEFNELLTQWRLFIPEDIRQNKVIIIKYTPDELDELQSKVRFECVNEELNISEKDKERRKQVLLETANSYPNNLEKILTKNGIRSIIKTENELPTINIDDYRYILRPKYICSLTKRTWVITMSDFFSDRLLNHDYQLFLPINHSTLDLLAEVN